ncbi:MAG TPA: acetyl-CoA C-acetyltransferase [Vicinamibacterales bacterium]|nr:acetyl-CoA C-acetyltransferase [Vicinamibacterales bacterium]
MSMDQAVILSACRTPIGSFGGVFRDLSAADLGAVVIREAIARAGIDAVDLGDVVMGCVLQAGAGMNVARQAAMKAGVPAEVPAETVNRVCGSGLQAVVHSVEALKAGYVDLMLAGGTESMSNAPYVLKGARWGYRMGNAEVVDSMLQEGLTCAVCGCHMGMTAEEIVKRFTVTRADQDAFAAESQARAQKAIESGVFDREIVAVDVPQKKGTPVRVTRDEYPRAGTTVQTLEVLKAAFAKEGSVTAGNASGINDGAAALVVSTEQKARDLGRRPLARILSYCTTGVDPMVMGMGPVPAMRKAVDRAGMRLEDLDVIELNEAFAAQSLAVVRELGLDPARVNVHGGAIALGHPIGASGARILTTLVHTLQARGGGRGAASLCVGGGMGTAMIVEAL